MSIGTEAKPRNIQDDELSVKYDGKELDKVACIN